jgi:hypothetical protein
MEEVWGDSCQSASQFSLQGCWPAIESLGRRPHIDSAIWVAEIVALIDESPVLGTGDIDILLRYSAGDLMRFLLPFLAGDPGFQDLDVLSLFFHELLGRCRDFRVIGGAGDSVVKFISPPLTL